MEKCRVLRWICQEHKNYLSELNSLRLLSKLLEEDDSNYLRAHNFHQNIHEIVMGMCFEKATRGSGDLCANALHFLSWGELRRHDVYARFLTIERRIALAKLPQEPDCRKALALITEFTTSIDELCKEVETKQSSGIDGQPEYKACFASLPALAEVRRVLASGKQFHDMIQSVEIALQLMKDSLYQVGSEGKDRFSYTFYQGIYGALDAACVSITPWRGSVEFASLPERKEMLERLDLYLETRRYLVLLQESPRAWEILGLSPKEIKRSYAEMCCLIQSQQEPVKRALEAYEEQLVAAKLEKDKALLAKESADQKVREEREAETAKKGKRK